MTATSVFPQVQPGQLPAWTRRSPSWTGSDLVGDHPPDLTTGLCRRCPHGAVWPCPFARAHVADLARDTPEAGRAWLRWVADEITVSTGEHRDVVWARIVGWYLRQVDRVDAYRGNRGPWWRRPFHG